MPKWASTEIGQIPELIWVSDWMAHATTDGCIPLSWPWENFGYPDFSICWKCTFIRTSSSCHPPSWGNRTIGSVNKPSLSSTPMQSFQFYCSMLSGLKSLCLSPFHPPRWETDTDRGSYAAVITNTQNSNKILFLTHIKSIMVAENSPWSLSWCQKQQQAGKPKQVTRSYLSSRRRTMSHMPRRKARLEC